MNLRFYLINMANIAANNYKDRKILKRHKNFMLDRPSIRRPNNTRHVEFHAGQRLMSDTYFKPWLYFETEKTLKQNYILSACKCSLLQTSFSVLCWHVPRSWQIKFLVMYVHVLVFYIICSLTYFHIKIFVCVKQKISYLHSLWTQTIFVVESIRWICH